ncbi:MAG: hypothetical protein OXF01_16365, partial [Gemmatimonadetes bacterium]|nr:hypothetical protein [Gemmatimonadota bacterium]
MSENRVVTEAYNPPEKMTTAGRLTSFPGAVAVLGSLLVPGCAGGPMVGVVPSPPDTPGAITTATPTTTTPPTPPTCGAWNGRDFFATASADLVQECLQAGANAHDPAQQTPAIFRAA